ncbi:MAG: hypothetical protein COX66_09840, partial [Elusimicrobia bacterium CG_4_10_14_0_2_um_filter_63_34]
MDQENLDPNQVNDVDTARLALRWSLEKIHGLQDQLNKAKETAADAVDKLRRTTEQITQKDAAILRWQSTIKTWEANWKDQRKLEEEIRVRVRGELSKEEDERHKEARRQLELHIESLKKEITEKESLAGELRRDLIDAVKNARVEKEKEMEEILAHQERALEETKLSLVERLRIQQDTIRNKERDLEEQQRLIDEKIKSKEIEFRAKYERFEAQLLKHNRELLEREEIELQQRFESKLSHHESMLRQKEGQFEGRRRQLDEQHAKRMEELEAAYHHKYEKEWGRLQERLEVERRLLEDHYREKESKLDDDILRRNQEVQLHYQRTEEELIAKYQTIQKQLIEKEKKIWATHQKQLDDSLTKNRAELDAQRAELEQAFEQKEAKLFEKQTELETAHEAKESALFLKQQSLSEEHRKKDEALAERHRKLQTELSEKAKADWADRSRKFEETMAEARQAIDAERRALEDRHREKSEELFRQRRGLEAERAALKSQFEKRGEEIAKSFEDKARASEEEWRERYRKLEQASVAHWAQRERELQSDHQQALEKAREKFSAQLNDERAKLDALAAKRAEDLAHQFLAKETELRREIQNEQTDWLRKQDTAFEQLRKELIQKGMTEAAELRSQYEAKIQALETQ